MLDFQQLKVALVHEWYTISTGSEKVIEQLLKLFPQADLFALVDFMPPNQRQFLGGRSVQTSFLQRMPFAKRYYRKYLPLMPIAIEQFDFPGYDLVISSNHAVAKGVITGPGQLHISYIHTPMRYAWDMQNEYLGGRNSRPGLSGIITRVFLHYIRMWDFSCAARVDELCANSAFVASRILKFYRRHAQVIYPPVDLTHFPLNLEKEDYYLCVSRLVPYKRVDLILSAFASLPDKKLVVIGEGPEYARLRRHATPNVTFLGYQPLDQMSSYMQRARAFVFAAQEDFGIAPVEAQACGTPVIAYHAGGAMETVQGLETPDPTGIFFTPQTADALVEVINRFESIDTGFSPVACRTNAQRFNPGQFDEKFVNLVNHGWYNLITS